MLIPDVSSIARYKYTGVNTLEVPFPFYETSSIHVQVSSSADVRDVFLLDYELDYSVSGTRAPEDDSMNAYLYGEVTLTTSGVAKLQLGYSIAVYRNTVTEQGYTYAELDNFPAKSHENALGKLMVICQELTDRVDRAITVPASSDVIPDELLRDVLDAADNAHESENLARQWASNPEYEEVADGLFSAFHYSQRAKDFAIDAANSADSAESSAQLAQETVENALTGIESAAQDARLSVVEEGTNQINGIIAEGDRQYGRAQQEANRAHDEADRAEEAARKAEDITEIKPASRTNWGIVRIGEGITVTADGTISVRISTVVSTPSVEFPTTVGIGFPYEAYFSASTGAAEASIDHFEVSFEDQPIVSVPATDDAGSIELTSGGAPGTVGLLSVVAVDTAGNLSNITTVTFTRNTVVLYAPAVLSPVSGATGVSINTTVNVQQAEIQGVHGEATNTHIRVARDAAFTDLVAEYSPENAYTTTYNVPTLAPATPYYVRARHCFDLYGWTAWGVITTFTTEVAEVNAPSIFNPTEGQTGLGLNPTISLSAFSNVGPTDTPAGTQIQVSSDSSFNTIVDSYDGTYLVGYNGATTLALETVYYVRARHKGNLWGWSNWSVVRQFTTTNASLATPTISSPAQNAVGVPVNGPVVLSTPTVVGQTVQYMQIQISTNAEFTVIVYDSGQMAYSQNHTIVPALVKSTIYYIRARLYGSITGWTAYGETRTMTTAAAAPNDEWVITSSETWTSPEAGVYAITIAGGGGGGGSGGSGGGSKNYGSRGGGGGGGGSRTETIQLSKNVSATAVIGGGGAGGASVRDAYGMVGGGGGGSSFTVLGVTYEVGGGGGGGKGTGRGGSSRPSPAGGGGGGGSSLASGEAGVNATGGAGGGTNAGTGASVGGAGGAGVGSTGGYAAGGDATELVDILPNGTGGASGDGATVDHWSGAGSAGVQGCVRIVYIGAN